MGSAPATAVGRGLAGVRVLEAGAVLVGITAQPRDLEWFDARVPTIRGPVHVSLDQRDGLRLRAVLPPNVSCRLELSAATAGVPDANALYVWTRGPAPQRHEEAGRLVLMDVSTGRTPGNKQRRRLGSRRSRLRANTQDQVCTTRPTKRLVRACREPLIFGGDLQFAAIASKMLP